MVCQNVVLGNTDARVQPPNAWRKLNPLLHVRKVSVLADKKQHAQGLQRSGDTCTLPAEQGLCLRAGTWATALPAQQRGPSCALLHTYPESGGRISSACFPAVLARSSRASHDSTAARCHRDFQQLSPKRKYQLRAVHSQAV